ncbi:mismatch-specific DNA-glycosylase [Leifsonia poae]|uniref:mismatch-specific DNA-glycosylase n=1 Tax=Leifsonia poae TaxID=110933 RepID=UPI003D688F12
MTFTRDQLAAFTGATLPDLIPHPTRLLIVGINPGLLTVAVQAHFARRGNRFYKALYLGGITDHVIDASNGFDPADVRQLEELGIGITCIVPEATARAAELPPARLKEGGVALRDRVADLRPTVVAILGISAYRVAFDAPTATVGRQADWGASQVWVVPNPSGLNAHSTLDDLASAYREVAVVAGIPVRPELTRR